ncbi:MAG: hypothetical protein LH616_15765, partial [Ilumatobacteraceae bacterium]|nr:hypothetical protein [Ilumatobacteraceae bacterium]
LIIGAGIKRVIFIEPYEKSRAERLYGSEIRFTTLKESRSGKGDSDVPKGRVDFVPYVGISPRRFQEVFSFVPRKLDDQDGHQPTLRGTKAEWTEGSATVRETIISDSALNSVMRMTDLIDHEGELIKEFDDELRRVANS